MNTVFGRFFTEFTSVKKKNYSERTWRQIGIAWCIDGGRREERRRQGGGRGRRGRLASVFPDALFAASRAAPRGCMVLSPRCADTQSTRSPYTRLHGGGSGGRPRDASADECSTAGRVLWCMYNTRPAGRVFCRATPKRTHSRVLQRARVTACAAGGRPLSPSLPSILTPSAMSRREQEEEEEQEKGRGRRGCGRRREDGYTSAQ